VGVSPLRRRERVRRARRGGSRRVRLILNPPGAGGFCPGLSFK
jgi:hypothetical protein